MQETEPTSAIARVAEASAAALIAALICAVPTVVRARGAGGGVAETLLCAVAVWLFVFTPIALLLPKAARGWRGVVGQSTPRKLIVGLALWITSCGALFVFLGTFLKANTHHRGLGGATFAVFATASALTIAVLVARATTVADALTQRPAWRWPLRIAAALVITGALVVVGVPLLQGDDGAGRLARAAIFDLLLAAVVASLVLTRRPPPALAGATRLTALPLALCIAVVGIVRVETSHAATAIRSGGGGVASILGALESWTDRDGDGMGSHFGGHDCDEGNPHRRPGATDKPGDGIDYDCDGMDAAPVAIVAQVEVAPEQAPSATTAATVVASAPKLPKQVDIIVVTLDTTRADHTTPYGYDKKTTPNLQALADRGVVFEMAYGAGSDTQRALVPVISGTTFSATPHTNKEWPRLRNATNSVAERMKAVGYATAGVSSFTWVRKDRGFAQGFDVLDESAWSERHPEREATGDLAIKAAIGLYGKLAAGSEPLYLWVHLFDPHDKYVEHAGIDFGKGLVGEYDGEIAFMDRELGKLIDAVNKGGRADRTVWVVHGTHGEAFGEHGQTGHGMQLYDESLRVPLICATPWSQPARYSTDAVSVLDVAPTVLDIAGANADGTSGVSLRAALEGKKFEREPVLAHANRRITVIDWPLKMHAFERNDRRDRLLLFDLSTDPKEEKDISADNKDGLVRLDAIRKQGEETRSDRSAPALQNE